MDLEDHRNNLTIVGKIFIIIGLIIIPITIVSYNSIHFLFDADWWEFDNHFDLGILNFHISSDIFYLVPALYTIMSLLLIVSGFGLIHDKDWAKKLALVPAVIFLFNFPVGTAIGIAALYLVLKEREYISSLHNQNQDSP